MSGEPVSGDESYPAYLSDTLREIAMREPNDEDRSIVILCSGFILGQADRIHALERNTSSAEDQRDAARYRALRQYLTVARDEPHAWTCWLELACIPVREKTHDPDVIVDWLVGALRKTSTPETFTCTTCGGNFRTGTDLSLHACSTDRGGF
jgi:hypothetical protein